MVLNAVLQQFKLKRHALDLYSSVDGLFVPNAVTRLFSRIVDVNQADTVFDIGTGIGVLAVWAALQPSKEIHAVDPVEQHCELAARNAELHHVSEKVRVYHGSLFDPLPRLLKANVIIGDVSGIADEPGRALGWYSSTVPTGGGDGTEVIVELLRQAPDRLAPGGKLYFPIAVGLSDSDKIMEVAEKCFGNLERKVDVWFPLPEGEYQTVASCLPPPLLARLRRRGSRMAWNGHIYEATNPVPAPHPPQAQGRDGHLKVLPR